MKPYRIYLLGGLRFESGSHLITRFRTQKTANLLAYLALHRGLQPREVLADLLWPDDAPEAARHSLRMALSSLRNQLESALQTPAQGHEPLFEATRFAIGLREGAVSTDVADFEAAIQNARRAGDNAERADFYQSALELYGGAFLPGFYDDWCAETATRLELAHTHAAQWLEHRRAPGPNAQENSALTIETITRARSNSATILATLLLFDGAPLSPALEKQLGDSGGKPLTATISQAQVWIFFAASPAVESAFQLEGARRIAVCTGETSLDDTNALVERGLGVLESAVTGQILGCETTALIERERAEWQWRDLGAFHLPRALPGATPERIFAVTRGSQAPNSSAPLRAQLARNAWVPRPLDAFFGRQSELETLDKLLQSERLITLSGAGGTGKTRLALRVAARWEGERRAPFGGAVFWVPLADVQGATGIAGAICDALRLEHGQAQGAFERASAALNRTPATLLVLDNFEHLVEDGAQIIEQLLARAPGASCLLTSRRVLGAHGERELSLGSLALAGNDAPLETLREAPSVQLFCDRARWARPDFTLTPRNAASIAALCRHLEGIPLAIELAAARMGHFSTEQILERLQNRECESTFERLDFLRNSARTAPARHSTLRAALGWSFEELCPAQQQFFTRLCVFRGGCTARAAQRVCQCLDELATAEKLEELRARSLLVRVYEGAETRYKMLELVRQFAVEVAGRRGEIETAQRAHADYFLEWAQSEAPNAVSCDAAARVQSWEKMRTEADNLRAAIGYGQTDDPATSLKLILACHNFSGAHLSRLELDIEAALHAVEQRGQVVASDVLGEAWSLAATQAAHRGDVAAQKKWARRRLEWTQQTAGATPEATGWAYFHWGSALHRNHETDAARAALEQSLTFFTQLKTPYSHQCRAWTLIEMGNNALDGGDFDAATRDFEACIEASKLSGDRDGEASARAQLAHVWFHRGELERAGKLWAQVAAIERELDDNREHEWRRHQEGIWAIARGDLERGHALLLRALRSFFSDGQKLGMLRSLLALSQFWLAKKQTERAWLLLQVEAAQREKLGWPADGCWKSGRARLEQNACAGRGHADALPSLESVVESELRAGR